MKPFARKKVIIFFLFSINSKSISSNKVYQPAEVKILSFFLPSIFPEKNVTIFFPFFIKRQILFHRSKDQPSEVKILILFLSSIIFTKKKLPFFSFFNKNSKYFSIKRSISQLGVKILTLFFFETIKKSPPALLH